ncbi:2,3-dihydro-2,3-dihydroxybenzoate dehydrogenase [Bailinhaonella thermotolerans]|uniref:2,3-dihydro-2,3-dihydroxybenzoate dehydrogenase n=1 Tax=Bailinhaonella thermotolerans TaxID=1070861 RepID=A0A3A4B047_9ACTN|nr:2,3-dihydro-2,3-dihydroxybenzoate dehydrogenase [Bailinhaonella thermotolerans]RJL30830.1 2,3-dihydro-2,3-dihydroxybenzoate dehydrogenase [Bailinhaonella thermotolerans]
MEPGISGAHAFVTGAARGIGEAVARTLAGYGARLSLLDRDPGPLARLARELDTPSAHAADVSDARAVEKAVAEAEDRLGPIGILVNVAGVLHTGPVAEFGDEEWARTFAVNTGGVFHVSRAVVRRMIPRAAGVIVTVASNAAGVPRAEMAAYAASKAAATMFTKCLGLEVARYGIRCNVVAPGSTDTAMQRALWTDDRAAERVIAGVPEAYRTGIPLGRIAEPGDIADAVAFLASDRARHITMHDLYVDGGATLRA